MTLSKISLIEWTILDGVGSVRIGRQVNPIFNCIRMKVMKRVCLSIHSHESGTDIFVYIITNYFEAIPCSSWCRCSWKRMDRRVIKWQWTWQNSKDSVVLLSWLQADTSTSASLKRNCSRVTGVDVRGIGELGYASLPVIKVLSSEASPVVVGRRVWVGKTAASSSVVSVTSCRTEQEIQLHECTELSFL